MGIEAAGFAGALGLELIHALLAAAAHALVGGDDDALDAVSLLEGSQRHEHLDGRAVRVRDDVVIGTQDVTVDFGDDQFLGRVHAPVGRIVHDAAADGGKLGCEFAGGCAAGAEDGDGRFLRDRLVGAHDRPFAALELNLLSDGARGGDRK